MKTMKAAAIVAALGAGISLPAHADWVFKMMNLSDVEAKGVVQNVQVVWLKRGQVNDIRVVGDWRRLGSIAGMGPSVVKHDGYVVNFENLANAGDQYCVWKAWFKIDDSYFDERPVRGKVTVHYKLEHQKPGFVCEVSGQTEAKYGRSEMGNGITQNFVLKRDPGAAKK